MDRTPPWRRLFRGVFSDRGSPLPSPTGGRVAELRGAAADLRGAAANDLTRRNSRSRSPFKAQKAGRGTSSWQLKEFAEATLGSGSLRKAVVLPEGEDENEWLAVNGELI
jgi:MOB kinase activator 1